MSARATWWRDDAACRDYDPEYWFAAATDRESIMMAEAALRVCEGCPVTSQCLHFALDDNVAYGIFGGKTAVQRRSLTRPRRTYRGMT